MLLAIDVGNTQTVLGLFDGDKLAEHRRLATDASRTGDELGALLGEMLDLEIMSKLAPFAVMSTYNDRSFFSARVKPRSLKYHYVYSGWSIPALALK